MTAEVLEAGLPAQLEVALEHLDALGGGLGGADLTVCSRRANRLGESAWFMCTRRRP